MLWSRRNCTKLEAKSRLGLNALGKACRLGSHLFAGLFGVRRQRRPGVATQNLSKVWGLARHGAWMALVLALVFLAGQLGRSQEETISPARASAALRQAMDLYKGN